MVNSCQIKMKSKTPNIQFTKENTQDTTYRAYPCNIIWFTLTSSGQLWCRRKCIISLTSLNISRMKKNRTTLVILRLYILDCLTESLSINPLKSLSIKLWICRIYEHDHIQKCVYRLERWHEWFLHFNEKKHNLQSTTSCVIRFYIVHGINRYVYCFLTDVFHRDTHNSSCAA